MVESDIMAPPTPPSESDCIRRDIINNADALKVSLEIAQKKLRAEANSLGEQILVVNRIIEYHNKKINTGNRNITEPGGK